MDKILEMIMNFINENTTLLIIICVFLIFVLIGYLIDNSIKTKKMAKKITEPTPDNDIKEPVVNSVPDQKVEEKVETSIIEPEVNEIKVEEQVDEEPTLDTKLADIENNIEEKQADIIINTNENNEEPIVREIAVDPKVNDLLLRDFSTNETSVIEDDQNKESIIESPVNEEPFKMEEKVQVELPKTEVKTSPYKNSKSLSDILKKAPVKQEEKLLKTEDYSNELDRILKKLNEESNESKDSTLDETTDFTNMF